MNKLPKMPKRETEFLVRQLREIARVAKMEHAHFGENTEAIKEQTKVWRTSWIVEPLEKLIERYEKALKP